MNARPTTFLLDDKAEEAASAFERYNLISAAVTDAKGKLIGRITVEDVIDLVNEENQSNIRKMGGISQGRRVCTGAQSSKKALDLAGRQPVHGVYRLARHWPV
ncbi:hypothetical protein E05_26410 [Plautia stali symbiont]|nr:hypothetical protein E05_26410 [Plautia stali symbiont]